MDVQNAQLRTDQTEIPAKRRRWIEAWPVLIPVLLIGGLLWISLWYKQRAQLFEDAGNVEFDAPTWSLVEMVGGPEMRALIGSPSSLNVGGEHPTDSQLRLIAGFSELTRLSINGLADADLMSLRGLTKLKHLGLHHSTISDAGCAALAEFPDLESLTIQTDQRLSRVGMDALRDHRGMRWINLRCAGFTDQDLEPLRNLDGMESLWIHDASFTGDGLKYVAEHPQLRTIALSECQVSPAALSPLTHATGSLRVLLNGSTITDEHLEVLGNIPWLQEISCVHTQVTRAGCQQFAEAHPGVEIRGPEGEQFLVDIVYDPASTP